MTLTDTKKRLLVSASVVFIILLIDQIIKIWVKTHFYLGESYHVFGSDWFQIHYIENYGMAFGMELAGSYGKILLSLFRIFAICAIAYYIVYLAKRKAGIFLIITISLIFAGAIGNIVDSAFYGLIFSDSTPFDKAVLFPAGGGYSTFLHGKVVDMIFFPLFTVQLPSWLPFWGGQPFTFFDAIFNIADATITTGVLTLILFQKKLFKTQQKAISAETDTQQPQGK